MQQKRRSGLAVYVMVGAALLLLAYLVLFLRVVNGDGTECTLLPVLLTGAGVAGGLAFNRVGAEVSGLVFTGMWLMTLAPLLAVWMFAAVLPPLGVVRAIPTATDIALALVILGAIFGAWGLLSGEEATTEDRVAAGAFGAAGLAAIVAIVSGLADVLVAVTLVFAFAAHATVLVTRWRATAT